jgi:hypothetical protein
LWLHIQLFVVLSVQKQQILMVKTAKPFKLKLLRVVDAVKQQKSHGGRGGEEDLRGSGNGRDLTKYSYNTHDDFLKPSQHTDLQPLKLNLKSYKCFREQNKTELAARRVIQSIRDLTFAQ